MSDTTATIRVTGHTYEEMVSEARVEFAMLFGDEPWRLVGGDMSRDRALWVGVFKAEADGPVGFDDPGA